MNTMPNMIDIEKLKHRAQGRSLQRNPKKQVNAGTPRQYYTFDEFTWHFFHFSPTAVRNRIFDSLAVKHDITLRDLHDQVMNCISAARNWRGYDYGNGYLYQGFRRLEFSGW